MIKQTCSPNVTSSNDMKPMMLLPPCSSPGSSQMHHGNLHESPHGFRLVASLNPLVLNGTIINHFKIYTLRNNLCDTKLCYGVLTNQIADCSIRHREVLRVSPRLLRTVYKMINYCLRYGPIRLIYYTI